MSEMRDIIQHISEVKDPFPPADSDDVKKRQIEDKAKLEKRKKESGIRDVDEDAVTFSTNMWQWHNQLYNRLAELRRRSGVSRLGGSINCNCDLDALEDAGEERETCDLIGDNEYVDIHCLRCGGQVNA